MTTEEFEDSIKFIKQNLRKLSHRDRLYFKKKLETLERGLKFLKESTLRDASSNTGDSKSGV